MDIKQAIDFRKEQYNKVIVDNLVISRIDEACAYVNLGYVVTDAGELAENWAPKEWTQEQWELFAAEMSAIKDSL